jgi:ubiquinone/menaquinone biosynthesis C-methylase UbiE
MSERFKAAVNVHDSKNTRLPIVDEFANYRFGRDALAHVSRYLFIVEKLMDRAQELGRPIRVLDVGCGDIYIARTFVASFVVKKTSVIEQYVGFDIDDKRLEKTKATAPKSFPVKLVCGDITDKGLRQFQSKQFDVITCTEVLEHIRPEFVEGVLAEFKRVACYGYISTPNFTGGTGEIPDDHIKEWDCAELTAVMEKVGIKVEQRIGVFSNLAKVKKLAAANPRLNETYEFLKGKMDAHFLSLCMARFIGIHAQNVLYFCDFGGPTNGKGKK